MRFPMSTSRTSNCGFTVFPFEVHKHLWKNSVLLTILGFVGHVSWAQSLLEQPRPAYQGIIVPQPRVYVENREASVFNWTDQLNIKLDTGWSDFDEEILMSRLLEALPDYILQNPRHLVRTKLGNTKGQADVSQSHHTRSLKKKKPLPWPEIWIEKTRGESLRHEGYVLDIVVGKPVGIRIRASQLQGAIWALRSLQQLKEYNRSASIVKTHIEDNPAFPYRGMHLDVSRHFFGTTDIKRYIDWLSFYKFNVFHWHLCDDQGWRIEIKRYPKLTQVGAWRVDRNKESWRTATPQKEGEIAGYGGYYSQEEVRELVAYAKARGVEIIPEIELPGHSAAALAAYPELSCSRLPQTVVPGGFYPPGTSSVYCAGNESTFQFLEGVLDEVMNLFPESSYIHIGGDEVDKAAWKSCLLCQQRIKVLRDVNSLMGTNGLSDPGTNWDNPEERLQSYFIARIEKYLNEHGRSILGWDEILEGGLAPNAAVMSWRGERGGIEAAQMKHPVVMTPGSPCYFDHYQGNPSSEPTAFGGMNTLYDVFTYRPIPRGLDTMFWPFVMGAQGNVWTEFMLDFDRVEYMVLPRMLALGEVLWHGPNQTELSLKYQQFLDRVDAHARFDCMRDCGFSRSQYGVVQKIRSGRDTVWVELMSAGGVRPRLASGLFDTLQIRSSLTGKTWQSFEDLGVDLIPYDEKVVLTPNKKTDSSVIVAITKSMQLYSSYSGEVRVNTLSFRGHKAFGKRTKLSLPADARYPGHGAETLTDGLFGTDYFGAHWLGFYGKDVVIDIDLDSVQTISSVTLGSLSVEPSWIFTPTEVTVETSIDGKSWELHPMPMPKPIIEVYDTLSVSDVSSNFTELPPSKTTLLTYYSKSTLLGNSKYAYDEIWGRNMSKSRINYTVDFTNRPHTNGVLVSARYLRVSAKCLKKLPASHLGAGNPAWLFVDEVIVK